MKDEKKSLAPILLKYYKGIFDDDEFEIYKNKLIQEGIYLRECDKNNIPMASFEDLSNMISLCINYSTLQFLFNNIVITGVGYDIFKATVIWMWNSLKGKKIIKHYVSGKDEEKEITFGLDVKCKNNNITMRLTGDFTDEDKNRCIDNAFAFLKDINENSSIYDKPNRTLARYDNKLHKWYSTDMCEEINKIIENQNKDH